MNNWNVQILATSGDVTLEYSEWNHSQTDPIELLEIFKNNNGFPRRLASGIKECRIVSKSFQGFTEALEKFEADCLEALKERQNRHKIKW